MAKSKIKVTASIDTDLVDWIDKQIGKRKFASRTHALEVGIAKLIEEEGSR
jgi:Arc/MetJ-type ribon-helix-helix transcriptional regulator